MKASPKIIFISLLLFLYAFIIPGHAVLAADPPRCQDMAQVLNSLGLLAGSPQGFELEKIPGRAQGAVMLVRLLGKEADARSSNYSHPFDDTPPWADPYIGYMYQHKLSQGISPTLYNPQGFMSAAQYAAFILRALGYDDRQGDFSWNFSLDKAASIGLLNEQTARQFKEQSLFRRDDMVFMSYQALQTKIKGQNQTLLQKLVADKAVSLQAAQQSGLYHNAEVQDDAWPISTSPVNPGPYTVNNHSELSYCLEKSILGLQDSIVIKLNYHDALDNFEAAVDKALHSIEKATGLSNLLKSWKYQGTDESITVTITYRYTTQQLTQLKNERDRIISDNITASMSDYEKEKVLHDYIIEHCRYDYQNLVNNTVPPDSYTAYGVLLKGSGVCQGYAEAMNILARKAGLESIMISGNGYRDGGLESHAWNLVKIGGNYYHLDVTWNDPVVENGPERVLYTYFNLNDKEIQKDHSWETGAYPQCVSDQFNYYIYNKKYVMNFYAFKDYINNALQLKEPGLDVKVMDFNPEEYRYLKNIVFDNESVSSISYNIDETFGIINIVEIKYY